VFHCFTGDKQQAEKALSYDGFKLGVGGVLTFKNSGLDKTMKDIDLNHLILETDSPYLAPAPNRGKRNETAYLRLIAERLADVKGISVESVARETSENAIELFNLPVAQK
jgi:TatD DNase family protein